VPPNCQAFLGSHSLLARNFSPKSLSAGHERGGREERDQHAEDGQQHQRREEPG